MHIKKDLKNNIENLNLNQLEKKTTFFIMKKLISNHRVQSKQNFLLKPLSFKTVVTFLPFALGVAELISKKYTPQQSNLFFQKNLPAFTFLNPKINLETLEYILKSNFVTTGQINLEESARQNDFSHLIQENFDKKFFFGHPNFIARLKKPKIFSEKIFNGILCNFDNTALSDLFLVKKQEQINIQTNFYKNLDELPSYLKGIRSINEKNRLEQKMNRKPQLSFFEEIELGETQKSALCSNLPIKDDLLISVSFSQKGLKSNKNLITLSDQFLKTLLISKDKTNFLISSDFFKQDQNNKKNPFFLTPSVIQKKVLLINDCNKEINSFSYNVVMPTSKFLKNQYLFYKNLFQFQTELQNIFLAKNLFCLPKSELNYNVFLYEKDEKFLKKFLNQISYKKDDLTRIDETFLLEKILQKIDKKSLAGDFPGFRLMSGYKYPDMNNPDIYWFSFQYSFLNKWTRFFFKCEKSSFLSSSKNYTFTIQNLPTVLIETKKLIIKNFDNNRIFYNGPTLLFDSKKALDWRSHGEQSLRSWFSSYLSPHNPLIQSKNNFFGIYYSPEFSVFSTDKNELELKRKIAITQPTADFTEFTKKSFFNFKYNFGEGKWYPVISSLKNQFAPFNYSLHIPSRIHDVSGSIQELKLKSEEKKFFIRGVDLNFSNTENKKNTEYFLPVVQIQQPRFTRLSTNSDIFQLSSNFVETNLLGKVDYTLPTKYFDQKGFINKNFSGHYKKISSLFSTTKKPSFVLIDNWEPLTSNSWLILSQLSFAIFIFQILKALADNYGQELLGYLLDLVSALGVLDDSLKQEIEILMGQREKGFRIILKSKKNFTDIVGIRKLLPEIYELVWFLRNSGRDFALSKTLPRGVLLTGPPGTGKTLLVQALAGEAQVPVLVLSGSSLIQPGESGALKLEMLFQEARELSPCIVFIDEIDTLAQKRNGVVQNPMGPDELLESLTSFESSKSKSFLEFNSELKQQFDPQIENFIRHEPKQEQLSLLMQFLIELDGIQGRDGVIVIGATNRPEVLDPAVLRPGRFDKILQVGLPGQQKRIEILKFYSQFLGYNSLIPWDYLGQRTEGFTAADLSTVMNESSIKSILNKTAHTIETIEHGIDRITTSQSEKYIVLKTKSTNSGHRKKLINKNKIQPIENGKNVPFFQQENLKSEDSLFKKSQPTVLEFSSKITLLRLAYYQAGKILVSHILETHPDVLVAYLWPRRTTIRSLQITTNLQNSVFHFARLVELNERIIASYAGKAAEFLFLEGFSQEKIISFIQTEIKTKSENIDKDINDDEFLSKKSLGRKQHLKNISNVSTLGLDDLLFAQKLIYCLIEKWFFYSKKFRIQKTISLFSNINIREFSQNKEKLEFYNQVIEIIQTPPMAKAWETQTSSLFSNKQKLVRNSNSQNYYSLPWWQQEISSELEFVEKNFANWSRIYLSNPEQSDRNPEWLPPDEFYHTFSGLKNVKKSFKNLSKRKFLKKTKIKISNTNLDSISTDLKNQNKQTIIYDDFKKVHLTWNDIRKITRDYSVQSIVLQAFNKTLSILNSNREILDRIVVELLYREILREPELTNLFRDFENFTINKNDKNHIDKKAVLISNLFVSAENLKNKNQRDLLDLVEDKNFKILELPWGQESRKKLPRWIDFEAFK